MGTAEKILSTENHFQNKFLISDFLFFRKLM